MHVLNQCLTDDIFIPASEMSLPTHDSAVAAGQSDTVVQTPSTGLRHPSFSHCRI